MRSLTKSLVISAPIAAVWNAWTTEEGARKFFAPHATIELRPGGRYEMLFDLDQPDGKRGGEGLKLLSYLPGRMLSFEWNAPPHFPTVRGQRTWVVVNLEEVSGGTEVELIQLGWGSGDEWEMVYLYFQRAWEVVLARLARSFERGPIDWNAPYFPEQED